LQFFEKKKCEIIYHFFSIKIIEEKIYNTLIISFVANHINIDLPQQYDILNVDVLLEKSKIMLKDKI
jgi:hypothetical protein